MKISKNYQSRDCGPCYAILPLSDSNNQESRAKISYSSHNPQNIRLTRLTAAIEQKNLHDCLGILEEAGFGSEIALFVLGYIQQSLEVAAP